MRVPWTTRKSNQSFLKEINPEYALEGLMMLGKIEVRKRSGQQKMRWLDGITKSMDMNLSKLQEIVKGRGAYMLQSMGWKRVRHNLATEYHHQFKEPASFSRQLWPQGGTIPDPVLLAQGPPHVPQCCLNRSGPKPVRV